MSSTKAIDAIGKAAGTFNKDFISAVPCTVSAIDLSTRSCTCEPLSNDTDSDFTNVQLMAEVNDGFLLVPAIDSTVIVNYSQRNVPYVAMYSELQEVIIYTAGGIQLQGDEYGGMVKVSDLVDRLNKIENAFNTLNTKVNSLAPTPVIPPLIVTQKSDIENPIVQHGK